MTRLKAQIKEQGRTQKWLANKVGVAEETIARYVSGKQIPRHDIAEEIAKWLVCDTDDIFLDK